MSCAKPGTISRLPLTLRFLLDTNIVIRYLLEPAKLSRPQARILKDAVRRQETLAVSAITLLEIALLLGDSRTRLQTTIQDLLGSISGNPLFTVLPLTLEIAAEVAALGPALQCNK